MASASTIRRSIAAASRRLVALLDEAVAPRNAVQILAAEGNLPAQTGADSALPLSAAIGSIAPHKGGYAGSGESIVAYVAACESRGRGDAALRLLGRLKVTRATGRTSLGVIGLELALLVIVLLIHSIFVLPQFQAIFESADTPLPAFTQVVFALIGPSSPFVYVALVLLLLLLIWRLFPSVIGPLLQPMDRMLLALPLAGARIRQSNSDRISGWLGFAGADAPSQRAAIEAAQAWYSGDLLARACAEVLRAASAGTPVAECLAKARGFDSEFRAAISLPDREDSLASLRARWRIAATLPERSSSLEPALLQIALGVIVAAVVIAMYLPLFKMASLL